MGTKDYADAIVKYSLAIQLWPSCASYYGNRAAAYSFVGQDDFAIEDCFAALRIDPGYSKAYGRLGLVKRISFVP